MRKYVSKFMSTKIASLITSTFTDNIQKNNKKPLHTTKYKSIYNSPNIKHNRYIVRVDVMTACSMMLRCYFFIYDPNLNFVGTCAGTVNE